MNEISAKLLNEIYQILYQEYGPQGWWPLLRLHNNSKSINPTKTGSINGYHPGNYSYPKTYSDQWEIIMGSILTQNTNWVQVEKALLNLQSKNIFTLEEIIGSDIETIKEAIRPAGYFNQKAKRLKNIAEWFLGFSKESKCSNNKKCVKIPNRHELLSLNGVGPETADSILLYGFSAPQFIVDAYAKRILVYLDLIKENEKYEGIKAKIEVKLFPTYCQSISLGRENISKNINEYKTENLAENPMLNPKQKIISENIADCTYQELVCKMQEFHALIVEHAKRYYSKKPYGKNCFLKKRLNL